MNVSIKALSSILDAMKPTCSPPTVSCSEYDPNDYSELKESKADGLSCSPNKTSKRNRVIAELEGVQAKSLKKVVIPEKSDITPLILAIEPAPQNLGYRNYAARCFALNKGNAYEEDYVVNFFNCPPINMEKGFIEPVFITNGDISDAKKNCHNDSALLVPLTYIAGKKATHLGDSDTTPKSCLDVVSKVLANSNDTSSMKSLPESVRLLQSEIQAERHASAQLLLQLPSLWKINQKYRTSIDAMQLELEDLSVKQAQSHQLAQLLALQLPGRANLS